MATHGGSRPGAGRTHAYREPLRRVTVTLPASYIEQLRRYGDDNLSEGIRLLVEEARTATGRPWYVMPEWAKDPKAAIHPPRDKRSPPCQARKRPAQGGPVSEVNQSARQDGCRHGSQQTGRRSMQRRPGAAARYETIKWFSTDR